MNIREYTPSLSAGVDPTKFVSQEASKDSLTGKNSVKEYKTGTATRGAGPDGGKASKAT